MLVKDQIVEKPLVGKVICDYEIICFKEVGKDKTVCDIQKFKLQFNEFKDMQKKLKNQK